MAAQSFENSSPNPSELTQIRMDRAAHVAQALREGSRWYEFQDCSGYNAELFDSKYTKERREAAGICKVECPVSNQCLQEAYRINDTGNYIRAGFTPSERRIEYVKMRKQDEIGIARARREKDKKTD